MTMRYDNNTPIGTSGATYEFNVKIYGMDTPGLTDEGLGIEAQIAADEFADKLRKRYKWVGEVYLTGRSGGWLAVQDKDGKARESTLKTIDNLVKVAKMKFIKEMEKRFPRQPIMIQTEGSFDYCINGALVFNGNNNDLIPLGTKFLIRLEEIME
jgi:hypothetical protein